MIRNFFMGTEDLYEVSTDSGERNWNIREEVEYAGWDGTRPLRVIATVERAVWDAYSEDPTLPAMRTGDFGGMLRGLTIIIEGWVQGAGGDGGKGGGYTTNQIGSVYAPTPGGKGGDAILVEERCTIIVKPGGEIRPGGGGGGGAAATYNVQTGETKIGGGGGGGGGNYYRSALGGAGGGFNGTEPYAEGGADGAGQSGGAGGDGKYYPSGSDAVDRKGGDGGSWGQPGAVGGTGLQTDAVGGAAGRAIFTNGQPELVTVINEGGTIYGAIE